MEEEFEAMHAGESMSLWEDLGFINDGGPYEEVMYLKVGGKELFFYSDSRLEVKEGINKIMLYDVNYCFLADIVDLLKKQELK